MIKNFNNPFSDYGRIVSRENFIGREIYFRHIETRIVLPKDPNNIALVGYPKIGKSSIAQEFYSRYNHRLLNDQKLLIWINIGTLQKCEDLFQSLIFQTILHLEENQVVDARLQILCDRATNTSSWVALKNTIERFFTILTKMGWRIIFILDEFDHARNIFKENFAAFQELRELGYRGNFKVTFITTSRRSIKEIEVKCAANSVLDLIFKKVYLSMYDDGDVKGYFDKYSQIGIFLTEDEKTRIIHYCGYHPYLLAVLGFEIVELFRTSDKVNVDDTFRSVQASFIDYYKQLISLLEEDGSLFNLMQIVFGPRLSLTPYDIDELSQYGLIIKKDLYYSAFSEHFRGYLYYHLQEFEVNNDTWKLLILTEKRLREIVDSVLTEKFGHKWENNVDKIKVLNPAAPFQTNISKLVTHRETNIRQYGTLASNLSLINYSFIRHLFDYFIFPLWDSLFKDVLSNSIPYWEDVRDTLIKVRNPLAHSNPEMLYEWQLKKAALHCHEIVEIYNQISQKNS